MGMVNIQATAILLTNRQRTIRNRCAVPTPTIDELITCVVLTGAPTKAAPSMTTELATCEVNAWMGRTR